MAEIDLGAIDLGEIGGGNTIDLNPRPPVVVAPPPVPKKKTPGWRDSMAAVGGGMYGAGLGLAQLATEGANAVTGGQIPYLQETKASLRDKEADRRDVMNALAAEYEGTGIANPINRLGFWGEILPSAATGSAAANWAGKGAGLLSKALRGSAVGAGYAAPMPLTKDDSRLGTMAVGGAFGGALPFAGAGAEAILGRAKFALAPGTMQEITEYGLKKGAKPSFINQQTPKQRANYYKSGDEAVQEIIKNKENLKFKTGDEVVSRLPQSLQEFTEAIATTKKSIFEQFNNMAQEAGHAGVSVPTSDISRLLDAEIAKKVNQANPAFIEYANQMKTILDDAGSYTPAEAQELMAHFNQSLKTFYNNPSKQTQGQAAVDALMAGALREKLGAAIEGYAGPGYRELKKKYGSLTTIEKDVNRRAAVEGNKGAAGYFDLSDTYAGQHAAMAIMKMDPHGLAAAGGAHLIKRALKYANDPNRIIKQMFQKAEKQMPKPVAAPVKSTGPEAQKMLPPGQGFTMKPYIGEVVPPAPPAPARPQIEHIIEGEVVRPQLMAPKAPGVVEASWTPTLRTGPKPGVFTMEGPQGKANVSLREARKKLSDLGYPEADIDAFLTQMMQMGR